ncbi:four helix bundle protein [Candidatus Collierbacteria bacterium]|nr:four helix bundle protein [Candidatus Collierbacteria bacterium]
MSYDKIQSFRDLLVWQQAHQLVLSIYKTTKTFPREEMYSLVDQIRRAVVSVTSNIAEGFGRRSYKEKLQFYNLAMGSLTEVENQIDISHDLGYISRASYDEFVERILSVKKLLNRLMTATKSYS